MSQVLWLSVHYSQLEAELLEAARALAHEDLADTGAAREADLAHGRVLAQLLAHSRLSFSLVAGD